MQLNTPEETRAFLRLCLNPGYGVSRTPAKLAKVMPPVLRDRVETFAPHLAEIRRAAESADHWATVARARHADALRDWIDQDAERPAPEGAAS